MEDNCFTVSRTPAVNRYVRAVAAILRKEIILLVRSREAIAAELYFLVGAALVLIFAFPQQLDGTIQAGAIWVVLYFAAMLTVARSYLIEQEQGTLRYLMHVAPADATYWGKLLASVLWIVIVGLVEYAVLMLIGLVPFRLGVAAVLVAGCIAIGGATSLLAGIVAAAQLRGWVFAAIAFPVVMPVFLVGVDATATVLAGSTATAAAPEVGVMLLYVTIVAIVAWWLFPFIWSEA